MPLNRTIDRRKRLIIAMDAAFGMEYLHGKNIVHFDLKCENLLVNMRDPHRPVCKVYGFTYVCRRDTFRLLIVVSYNLHMLSLPIDFSWSSNFLLMFLKSPI